MFWHHQPIWTEARSPSTGHGRDCICMRSWAGAQTERASSPWHEVNVSPTHSSKLAMTRTRSSGGIMTLKSPGVYVGSISPCVYTDHEIFTQFPQKDPPDLHTDFLLYGRFLLNAVEWHYFQLDFHDQSQRS